MGTETSFPGVSFLATEQVLIFQEGKYVCQTDTDLQDAFLIYTTSRKVRPSKYIFQQWKEKL